MRIKLLKKLRKKGRNQIHIYSITKQDGIIVGMSISYDEDIYNGLFEFGLTENDVLKKAENIFINKYLAEKRKLANEQ